MSSWAAAGDYVLRNTSDLIDVFYLRRYGEPGAPDYGSLQFFREMLSTPSESRIAAAKTITKTTPNVNGELALSPTRCCLTSASLWTRL